MIAVGSTTLPYTPAERYFFAPDWSSFTSVHTLSDTEKSYYYRSMPSSPRLVYRSGSSPRVVLQLEPVLDHKIVAVWKVLGPLIVEHLDSAEIMWTSIDGVRFKKVGEARGPVVLWIGVIPESLCWDCAHTAALGCLAILKEFDLTDVEVDFRESWYNRLAGPKLLEPADFIDDSIRDFRAPLTPVLGLHIADACTKSAGGTGGLYIAEGGNSTRVLLITARHIFPSLGGGLDADFALPAPSNTQSRHEVLLLGGDMYENYLKSIKDKLDRLGLILELCERRLASLMKEPADCDRDMSLRTVQGEVDEEKTMIEGLERLHDEAAKHWSDATQRILGHVVCSPPLALGVGAEGYTEDCAVIELDSDKFSGRYVFKGNVIELGVKIEFRKLFHMMASESPTDRTFKYPWDHLLKLKGFIEEDKLRYPETFDREGKPALIVLKNGAATGLTVGRATGVFSFVREYLSDGTGRTSTEWAILPYDREAGVFAAAGDSGAVIADGRGLVGGLLTGGSVGDDEGTVDIVYATPMAWLFERVKANGFPDAHLDPVIA